MLSAKVRSTKIKIRTANEFDGDLIYTMLEYWLIQRQQVPRTVKEVTYMKDDILKSIKYGYAKSQTQYYIAQCYDPVVDKYIDCGMLGYTKNHTENIVHIAKDLYENYGFHTIQAMYFYTTPYIPCRRREIADILFAYIYKQLQFCFPNVNDQKKGIIFFSRDLYPGAWSYYKDNNILCIDDNLDGYNTRVYLLSDNAHLLNHLSQIKHNFY